MYRNQNSDVFYLKDMHAASDVGHVLEFHHAMDNLRTL